MPFDHNRELNPHRRSVSDRPASPQRVSNWGGYSLACCLAAKYKNRHSPDVPVTRIVPNVNDERESLRVLVELGVVDGMLRAPAMSVDGLDFEKIHAPLILQLVELASHQE
jgi:hypothetical protein